MCDGQRRDMQNYLREQKNSLHNINIVEEITSFLYEFSKRRLITSDILPLLIEAFQTLIELCSGNYDSSIVIFNEQIVSMINYYLQIDITNIKINHGEQSDDLKKEYIELRIKALKLKASIVNLLEVMLEKVSGATEKLTLQIAEGLDIHALHFTLWDFYMLKDDKDLKDKEADDNASRAMFKTYSVINHLIDSETGYEFGKSIKIALMQSKVHVLLF